MKRSLSILAVLAGTLLPAAPAVAGTYEVNTCSTAAGNFANQAWTLRASSGITNDAACGTSAADSIGLVAKAGAALPDNTYGALTFNAPAGTTIADWVINRRWTLKGAAATGNHRPFLLYVLGSKAFGGAGNYPAATRNALNAQKSWAGYPENDVALTAATPKASWGSLAAYDGTAQSLSVRLGCTSAGTPCAIPAGGSAENTIRGARVTLSDAVAPSLEVLATGLFGGGARSGSDPISLSASDGSGIATVEAFDVTDPAAPQLVATESYDPAAAGAGTTDAGVACASSRPKPCPDLVSESVKPTALVAGARKVLVRVTDRGGNVTDSVPAAVNVATPSDRGALNGTGATDTGKITGSFLGRGKGSKTVSLGRSATVRGTLVNAAGQPIGGAQVRFSTRDASSRRYVERGTTRTSAAGNYRVKLKGAASRSVLIGWRSHANDVTAAARVALSLRVRAGASLKAPRRVRLGRTFTLRGRLKGVDVPSKVGLVAQGHPGERGSFDTFKLARTDKRGRFKIRYRFESAASRGQSFTIRVRVLQRAGWPYLPGVTRTVRVRVR